MSIKEHPDEQQIEQALQDVLRILIPASRDGNISGAADIGFAALIRGESDYPALRDGLLRLMETARTEHGSEFPALALADQTRLVERLKVKDFRFFGTLSNQIIKYYYQNKDVLAALGQAARPPFPLGHEVEDGDLTLLEPVYERGRKYRE